MKLTFEQIKALTVGAVTVEQQDDGIHFFKCTKEQIAFYKTVTEPIGSRSAGTTGIRLDFLTDASRISVSVSEGEKYELHINGILYEQFLCHGNDSFEAPLPASDKPNRVTIYLPCHGRGGVIREIELTNASTVERCAYDCKMLFLGDSITQGWESKYDTLSFAYRTSNFFNAESVIQGIGGARFHPESVVPLPFDPDYLFIAFGTNDFDFYNHNEDPAGDFQKVVADYLDRIHALYRNKTVFVISPIPRLLQEESQLALFRTFCKTVGNEALMREMIHIDGHTLMPLCLPLFADEKVHPNDNGFSVYAENLIRQVHPHVRH